MDKLNAFLGKVVVQIINPIILLLGAAAFVVFLWGIYEFIAHAGDETKRSEGRSAIMWGLIGFVIIFGAYGIINLALTTVFPNNPDVQYVQPGQFSNPYPPQN